MPTGAPLHTPRELRVRSLLLQMRQLALETQATKQYQVGTYEGEVNDEDKRHGRGVLSYKPADYFFPEKYDGNWVNDKMQGLGVMLYNDRSVYSGTWEDGRRHGQGEMQYSNGDTYDGCWHNDNRVGQGRMIFQNKNEYAGIWQADKMSAGTYTNPSAGWSFTGTFDDVFPRAGTLTCRENERTVAIHSPSWQRASISEQKPSPAATTTPAAAPATSQMTAFYNGIKAAANHIKDEYQWWQIQREDRDHSKPSWPAPLPRVRGP